MRILLTLIAALCAVGAMADQKKPANLPTVTRVEFVLECVRNAGANPSGLVSVPSPADS
mgnify:CR=1 FL=1